jgi:flavorubredoxin
MASTRIDEVAERIYRISTFVPEADFLWNQYLVDADEPLLFHTGPRGMFGDVSAAVARVVPLPRLRWITFGHVESDECGSMNRWLAAAPDAQVAHGAIGCMVSLNDMADRPPRPLEHGEVLDLGSRRIRHLDTPHVPHGWEARVLYEETTGTLLCGDLFTATGDAPPITRDDLLERAMAAEDQFRATCLTPATAPTIRALADLRPRTLALMHGPAFVGDGAAQLERLAAAYAARVAEAVGAS